MRGARPFLRTRPRPTGGSRVRGAILLLALAAAAPAADGPAWTTKVPDFRSSWPEPLAVGSAAPEFSLRYEASPDGKTFAILSLGKDGKPGGRGPDADVEARAP
ncbi:MAG: type II secretion system protein GspG [Planctomycetes bacterium]|jgi:hypothetical protein|nr:type II secretion system protein GspG [Planctomycetota bacterium]